MAGFTYRRYLLRDSIVLTYYCYYCYICISCSRSRSDCTSCSISCTISRSISCIYCIDFAEQAHCLDMICPLFYLIDEAISATNGTTNRSPSTAMRRFGSVDHRHRGTQVTKIFGTHERGHGCCGERIRQEPGTIGPSSEALSLMWVRANQRSQDILSCFLPYLFSFLLRKTPFRLFGQPI